MTTYRVWLNLNVAQDADYYRVPYVGAEFRGNYQLVNAENEEQALAKARDQSLAYGTEEWWEYLRGNIDALTLVDRLTTLGLETDEWVIAEARMRGMALPVYIGLVIHFLPQPN